jgi:lipoprotein-releasing system permease protein
VNGVIGLFQNIFSVQAEHFSLYSSVYFYMTEVPTKIMPMDIVVILSIAVLVTVAAALAASRRMAAVKPAEVLRYE